LPVTAKPEPLQRRGRWCGHAIDRLARSGETSLRCVDVSYRDLDDEHPRRTRRDSASPNLSPNAV